MQHQMVSAAAVNKEAARAEPGTRNDGSPLAPPVGWRELDLAQQPAWPAGGPGVHAVGRAIKLNLVEQFYPADSTEAGQELRLRQEYFFVAASLQERHDQDGYRHPRL